MQLLGALGQVREQLAQLRQIGAVDLIAAVEGQAQMLAALQQQLASGTVPASVLRGDLSAIVANLATQASQAQSAAVAHAAQAERTLHEASAQARHTVQNFVQAFYEDRVFDKYLTFDSDEEARAYREREAAREQAIKDALAKNTPEGNRRALALMREQLEDAARYGADQSPEYGQWMRQAYESEVTLAAASEQSAPLAGRTGLPADPLDSIEGSTGVDPAIVAALLQAGVTPTDPARTGHGVRHGTGIQNSGWEVC